MPSRILYLVRHADYDPDPSDPVDGGTLTETGRRQASALADRLSGLAFDAVFHSTSLRAVQTVDLLTFGLPDGLPRHADELLRECIPTVPDRERLTKSQRAFFEQLPEQARADGPKRAQAAVEKYAAAEDADRRDLLVTHGNLINYFVAHALDSPPHGWLRPLDYHCGLTVLRFHSSTPPRLLVYNEIGHLPSELRGVEYPEDFRV